MSKTLLNLVVAMCNNRGIGKDGHLPWKMIRKDMDFFKKITSETKDPDKRNAVIMGRKTWFSIPEKFRPLPKRINIILSREMKEAPEGVYIARGLDEAMNIVTKDLADKVESIYIIGGSSIYKEAMDSDYSIRFFLTRVLAEYDCDTFLPEFDENQYKLVENFEGVPVGKQTDKDIDLIFEVYEKDRLCRMCDFNVMAAMCNNRGIALENNLPWPSLPTDYKYYVEKCSPKIQGKRCAVIKGRKTWDSTAMPERTNPGFFNIVISRFERKRIEADQNVNKVVQSLDEALEYSQKLLENGTCERVWILGGQTIYDLAVNHPCCKYIYLTHIYEEFDSDRFFPEIPEDFKEIRVNGVDQELQEENGIKFQFKVYSRLNQHCTNSRLS